MRNERNRVSSVYAQGANRVGMKPTTTKGSSSFSKTLLLSKKLSSLFQFLRISLL